MWNVRVSLVLEIQDWMALFGATIIKSFIMTTVFLSSIIEIQDML